MWDKSVFRQTGGRAQENYPRMESGRREWDATSVRGGVIGGHEMTTKINTGTQTSLDSTLILHAIGTATVALLVFHDCRWHAVRPWWLRMSSACLLLAIRRILFFQYVITRPQINLFQRRGEICWLLLQQPSMDGVSSTEKLVNFCHTNCLLLVARSSQITNPILPSIFLYFKIKPVSKRATPIQWPSSLPISCATSIHRPKRSSVTVRK